VATAAGRRDDPVPAILMIDLCALTLAGYTLLRGRTVQRASAADASVPAWREEFPAMDQVYLSITDRCNLRCRWCFWEDYASEHNDAFDLGAVTRAIGSCLNGQPSVTVVFYGGEPTLRMDRVRDVMARLPEAHPRIHWRFAVQTNGTRLSDVVPLADDLWYLSVSFNEYTLPEMDWPALEALATQLPIVARLVYAGGDFTRYVRAAMPHASHVYWQLVSAPTLPFAPEAYREALRETLGLAAESGRRFIPFDYAWACTRGPQPYPASTDFPCGIGKHLTYVDTDGNEFPCDELAFPEARDRLADALGRLETLCEGCDLLPYCRRRCPAIYVKHGPDAFAAYCGLTRMLFEEVSAAGYAGRVPDEVSLQCEVLP